LGGTPGTGSENKAIDDHHQIAFLERIWKEKLLFILKLWDAKQAKLDSFGLFCHVFVPGRY
jgi:hypothetical protein